MAKTRLDPQIKLQRAISRLKNNIATLELGITAHLRKALEAYHDIREDEVGEGALRFWILNGGLAEWQTDNIVRRYDQSYAKRRAHNAQQSIMAAVRKQGHIEEIQEKIQRLTLNALTPMRQQDMPNHTSYYHQPPLPTFPAPQLRR